MRLVVAKKPVSNKTEQAAARVTPFPPPPHPAHLSPHRSPVHLGAA